MKEEVIFRKINMEQFLSQNIALELLKYTKILYESVDKLFTAWLRILTHASNWHNTEDRIFPNFYYIPRRKLGIYWIQVRRAAAVEISLWTR